MEQPYGAKLIMPRTDATPIVDNTGPADREKRIEALVAIEIGNHFYLSALVDAGVNAVIYSMDWAPVGTTYDSDRRGVLKINPKVYSVPRPNPARSGAFLIDMGQAYTPSRDAWSKVVFKVPVERRLTVGELTQFIVDRNLHDFVFNANLGCRFWTITLLKLLQEKHFVPESTAESLQAHAEKVLGTETVQGMFPRFKQL